MKLLLSKIFSSRDTYYVIIIALLVLYIFWPRKTNSNEINKDNQIIQNMQQDINYLKKRIDSIAPQLVDLKNKKDTLAIKIKKNDDNIKVIQQTAKKTDSIIKSLTPDQLQQYLSNYQ